MKTLFTEHTIGELVTQIENGSMTARDLMQESLRAIGEDEFQAWVVRRTTADTIGEVKKGLLTGIPIAVKDIYNTEEFPTQMGSPLWEGFTPGNDARTVFNLKQQGAVVVGKTVTAEFAVHALERTRNPFDVSKTPGTSSSGSAVAVTLGHVPAATGTQTAGSIIRPASFCGIYGMKPSFGFLPRTGMLKTTDSLDTLGFLTIHLTDLRRMFDAMRVKGKNYPISDAAISDNSRQQKPTDRPWRVGFARTHTWEGTPSYAREAMEQFMQKLASQTGFQVSDAPLPESMQKAHSVHRTIYDKTLSYYFQGEYSQAQHISPIMRELIESGNTISIEAYKKALNDQTELIYKMDTYFDNFDVLISLSTAGEAPPRELTELPDPSLMWTLTHLPSVNVPVFRSSSELPFGMQVVARKYNDYLLMSFLDELNSHNLIPARSGYVLS